MIRPLRRRHLLAFAALSLALPLAFVLSLTSRQPSPANDDLSELAEHAPAASPGGAPGMTSWEGVFGTLSLAGGSGQPQTVEVGPVPDLRRPDVLLYWSPSAPTRGGRLPAESVLLGRFDRDTGGRYALPHGIVGRGGAFILFSLGHGEVVAVAGVPRGAEGG